jgi:hypothetical protein
MMNHKMLAIETQHYIDEVIVTIVKVSGRLDGATSTCFLNAVRNLVERGEDHIIFDLQEISTLGSGGLIALHQAAKLLMGEPMSLHDFGWGSFHALEHDLTRGESLGLKILRPSPAAIEMMVVSGFAALVEPYASLQTVVATFRHEAAA